MNAGGNRVQLKNFEELFGSEKEKSTIKNDTHEFHGKLMDVKLEELHDFGGYNGNAHPFQVRHNSRFYETLTSIIQNGVLEPGIVRNRSAGGYEMIAGHTRRECCKIAGLVTMPVFIRNLTDEEATIVMADTNLYREDISFSEKAWAYRMKSEALKCQREKDMKEDKKKKEDAVERLGRTDEILAKQLGETRNTLQRYIRLTYLQEDLLEMVDIKKIGFIAGSDLSYLNIDEQKILLEFIYTKNLIPNGKQAADLKEYSKKGEVNRSVLEIMFEDKHPVTNKLIINNKTLKKYFSDNYKTEQMEEIIVSLLEKWKEEQHGE